jgi:hypothetical protein
LGACFARPAAGDLANFTRADHQQAGNGGRPFFGSMGGIEHRVLPTHTESLQTVVAGRKSDQARSRTKAAAALLGWTDRLT